MTTEYRLPCECGNTLAVTQVQAGQVRICDCGAELEVPTIRGLAELQQVQRPDESSGPTWSRQQGALFVSGLFILILGAVTTFWLKHKTPEYSLEDPSIMAAWKLNSNNLESFYKGNGDMLTLVLARMNENYDQLSPGESLGLWSLYRDVRPFVLTMSDKQRRVDSIRDSYKNWTWIVAVVSGLVGLSLVGSAFAFRR
jgi:hypothetical protein